jgi:uncharacterized membrane protein
MHFWFGVRWLHLLAMAFFVGGQLVLAVAVVPALRGAGDADGLRSVARRFGWGTLVAFAVLVVTGAAMASHLSLWSDGTFQVKLTLVVVVAALLLWHVRAPQLHVLEALVFLCSLAIVWIGLYLSNGYS